MGKSITAADATYLIGISSLFPTPQRLEGFGVDDVFSTEAIKSTEVMMGVDGKLSGGFVYVEVPQTITLQADSPSFSIFDQWWLQQQLNKTTYVATGTVILRSVGTKWNMTKGFLTSYAPLPDAKKLLQARKFQITWERISPANV